ncbi:phosphonate ABC transporter, permease protein PhnE [Candidatus Bipolaricaulota bacterium]
MSRRPHFPKAHISALLIDWGIWCYMSYCIFFLISYLHQTFVALSRYDVLTFPSYGWPAAILGSLATAILWQSLGTSIGEKTQGLILVRSDRSAATMTDRVRRIPIDFLMWIMTLVVCALILIPFVGLATLFWNLNAGSGISFVPTIMLWPMGTWVPTLLITLASLVILVAGGLPIVYISVRLLQKLWGTGPGDFVWGERHSGTGLVQANELEQGSVQPRRWFQTSSGLMVLVLIGITLCVGWLLVDVDVENMITRAPWMARIVSRLLHPDLSTFATQDPLLKDSIFSAMVETIFMALFATLLGFVIAFPLSFLGARNLMAKGPLGWIIYTLTRAFFNIFRSVEVLIWAIIFAVWVSFGPFAGVIALAIHTIAALGKLYSEQVESIDPGPVEAMTAAGARRWQIIVYGIIPQIVPSFMAFTMYRWDINVRMSTVIGLVGGGGIGRMLFHYKNELEWEKVGAVVLMIIVVVWTMDYISGRVRERIS